MGILDSVTSQIDTFGLVGAITAFAIIVAFVIIAGFVTFYLIMRKIYFKTIIIFERVGGQIQVTKRDKGRDIRLGEAGDYIVYTKKFKKFLPPAEIQTGHNIFWYFIREDGEWINIGIKDIDEQMRQAEAHFLDKEMRFARTGMQKNLRERLQKITFWDKYGAMIIWTLYIAIVGVMTWLLFDKWIELAGSVTSAVDAAGEVMKTAQEVLQNIDNIKTGGTGIQPAS